MTLTASDMSLRERCIELALRCPDGDTVKIAQRFHDFITGRDPPSESEDPRLAAHRRFVEELLKLRDRA